MNQLIDEYYPVFTMYQELRQQLMDVLKDEDLTFSPGGAATPLGMLCREIGEVEQSYIDSFRTFTQDFSYRNEAPGLEQSVERLAAWYGELDAALRDAVAALTPEDLALRTIDRGHGFEVPPAIQLQIYQEALLIFYGKVSIYLKAMGKTLPGRWATWIE